MSLTFSGVDEWGEGQEDQVSALELDLIGIDPVYPEMYIIGGSSLNKAEVSIWARMYPSGGNGVGMNALGKNVGRLNYNSFKLKSGTPDVPGRMVTRPSFSSQTFNKHHWPWNR